MINDFRQRSGTVYHHSCTCRMGPDPATSVVDARLRVHGVEGLRVCDASVFPNLIAGNTNAPAMMVGWRGAEIILEDASGKLTASRHPASLCTAERIPDDGMLVASMLHSRRPREIVQEPVGLQQPPAARSAARRPCGRA